MIQRIQSVYLFIAGVCMLVALFVPVMSVLDKGMPVELVYNGWSESGDMTSFRPLFLVFFVVLTALFSLYAIMLYRKRLVQIKLCRLSMLLIVGYYIALGSLYFYYLNAVEGMLRFSWSVCLPFVALVFCYLAQKAIAKDEQMVRAADRLR